MPAKIGVAEAVENAQTWLLQAQGLMEGSGQSSVLREVDGEQYSMDRAFGPPIQRMAFQEGVFLKVADQEDLLIRKSERDLWALSEDGKSVVRLFNPEEEPLVLARTASIEERDAIAVFAGEARRQLVAAGLL